MTGEKFGTAINCIDGRVQIPVADWVKLHGHVQFVDMVTEPGADKVLAEDRAGRFASIIERARVSLQAHRSGIIAVAGHYDCAANPVRSEEHREQIIKGFEMIRTWNSGIRVVGLYVNEWNSVDVICDTEDEYRGIRSFL